MQAKTVFIMTVLAVVAMFALVEASNDLFKDEKVCQYWNLKSSNYCEKCCQDHGYKMNQYHMDNYKFCYCQDKRDHTYAPTGF